ncbi:MAG TPA: hypothetical protein VGH34_08845 [Vicinamibacterales bacterium]
MDASRRAPLGTRGWTRVVSHVNGDNVNWSAILNGDLSESQPRTSEPGGLSAE